MKQQQITYRIQNISSTAIQASKSVLIASTSATHKIYNSFANHQSQTNFYLQNRIKTMEISQSSNYTIADLKLSMRRTENGLKRHWRLVKNGHDDSIARITFDWFLDHLLYLWDVLWGIVRPILTMCLIVIIQLIVTLAVTTGVIYAVYVFITL